MVKRREPAGTKRIPTEEAIEAFVSGADTGPTNSKQADKAPPDPNAKRNYNAINVPFNEYEYLILEGLANKTGRTKLNTIRWAIKNLAEELQAKSHNDK